jgi:hypothetical protein
MNIEISLQGLKPFSLETVIRERLESLQNLYSFDLSGLEGVTVAENYTKFLASFDTGFEGEEILTASSGGNTGVGITPEVLRGGFVRSHIILPRHIALSLLEREDDARQSVYTLSHEAAHADEHQRSASRHSAEMIALHRQADFYGTLARACWGEYYACRKSAFSYPGMSEWIDQMVMASISDSRSRLRKISSDYRVNRDKPALDQAVTNFCTDIYIAFSRFRGHQDGLTDCGVRDTVSENSISFELEKNGLRGRLDCLERELRQAYETFGTWEEMGSGLSKITDCFREFFSFITG